MNYVERKNAAVPRAITLNSEVFAERALNAEIWDTEGRRFIDFAGGIAVLNTGHRHPRIMAAIKEQLDRFTHTCYSVVPYESYARLAERLNKLTPGKFAKKTIFLTTGAEAVENAVKIARAATGRSAVIAFEGGFHGRTFMGMALTGKVSPYKTGFGAMPGDVFHAPFPNQLHGVSVEQSLAAIKRLFSVDVDPRRVAAIIVEPVQGEGGFHPAPTIFLKALRELCDMHGILLIADEIQTGFARTGKMFAMDHSDVAPDLLIMAKSLAGGLPLSAVTGRADIMDAPGPGGLGGTYGGNPVAIAAAHAVLDVIVDEGLIDRANLLGNRLRQRLEEIRQRVPEIAEVRGPGFMIAIELRNAVTGLPSADLANKVRQVALEKHLMLLTCGVFGNVIRFLCPITVEEKVFAEALDMLERALLEATGPERL